MTRLPVISGAAAIRAFGHAGWAVARRESSHVTMKKGGERFLLTVPLHRELDRGLLRGLVRDSGLTVARFMELLNQ